MAKLTSFRELMVWQKSMSVAERCYRISKRLKKEDDYALGSQLRACCISVPSNIAEGFGRHYTLEYIHHLRMANGSNNEIQTQLELGKRLQLITADDAAILIPDSEEVGRMLHGLINSLQR